MVIFQIFVTVKIKVTYPMIKLINFKCIDRIDKMAKYWDRYDD